MPPAPCRPSGDDADPRLSAQPGRIFRKIPYGRLLDVFFVDLRSYREANQGGGNELFGWQQADWLKRELAASKATWKVIACDMPIGLVVWTILPTGRAPMRSPMATTVCHRPRKGIRRYPHLHP